MGDIDRIILAPLSPDIYDRYASVCERNRELERTVAELQRDSNLALEQRRKAEQDAKLAQYACLELAKELERTKSELSRLQPRSDGDTELHADELNRCAICGWPLYGHVDMGCVRGNCSARPVPPRARWYAPERADKERAR
jgi:hypothetical protein